MIIIIELRNIAASWLPQDATKASELIDFFSRYGEIARVSIAIHDHERLLLIEQQDELSERVMMMMMMMMPDCCGSSS